MVTFVTVLVFCFEERRGERNIHVIRMRFIVVEDYGLRNSSVVLLDMRSQGDDHSSLIAGCSTAFEARTFSDVAVF